MEALVTDVHLRNALSAIRGFGRAGIPVAAVGRNGLAPGRWSRFTAARATAPDVLIDPAGFRSSVVRIADSHRPVVLYPCQEESIDALTRAPLPDGISLPWPDLAALERVRDKRELPRMAADSGVEVPIELFRGKLGELPAQLDLPLIVKPVDKGQTLAYPARVHSEAELAALTARLPAGEPVIVQELGGEPLTAVVVLVGTDGELLAQFHQRAQRTWPPGSGPSTLAVSVPPDRELAERCAAMLASAGSSGLAELQFVATARGPAVIDVNARFYGSLALALASGVNFPALWHRLVGGERPGPVLSYREGVSYRWLEAELLAALRGRLGLLRPAPRPRTGAMWAADDPLPGLLMAYRVTAERVVGRLRRRGVS